MHKLYMQITMIKLNAATTMCTRLYKDNINLYTTSLQNAVTKLITSKTPTYAILSSFLYSAKYSVIFSSDAKL